VSLAKYSRRYVADVFKSVSQDASPGKAYELVNDWLTKLFMPLAKQNLDQTRIDEVEEDQPAQGHKAFTNCGIGAVIHPFSGIIVWCSRMTLGWEKR